MWQAVRTGFAVGATVMLLVAVVLCGLPGTALAQDHAEEQAGHGTAHEFHANHFALFFGGATVLHEDVTGFTIGVDYERRLSRLWGIGVLADVAVGDVKRELVLAVPLFVHPVGGLVGWVAPGLETIGPRGEDTEEEHAGGEEGKETEFLVRFGVGYQFALGRYSLAPHFNADVAGGRWTLVYGLALGIGF